MFLKALLPIDSRLDVGLIVKVVSFLHPANAEPPIVLTESGSTKLVNIAPVKHSCPIEVIPSGSTTLVRDVQFWKTPVLKARGPVKPSSKLMLVIFAE